MPVHGKGPVSGSPMSALGHQRTQPRTRIVKRANGPSLSLGRQPSWVAWPSGWHTLVVNLDLEGFG